MYTWQLKELTQYAIPDFDIIDNFYAQPPYHYIYMMASVVRSCGIALLSDEMYQNNKNLLAL